MNMDQLCLECRTIRKFTQEPVPDELLKACVQNARRSSSASNGQPVRYVAVKDPSVVKQMQPLVSWAGKLPHELGVPVEGEQPTAFIALPMVGGISGFRDIDLGIASHAIVATAWEAHVGSCMMGAIDRQRIKSLLDIPEQWELKLVIALGYPALQSSLEDVRLGDSLDYYLDAQRNYHVPKLALEDVARFI